MLPLSVATQSPDYGLIITIHMINDHRNQHIAMENALGSRDKLGYPMGMAAARSLPRRLL